MTEEEKSGANEQPDAEDAGGTTPAEDSTQKIEAVAENPGAAEGEESEGADKKAIEGEESEGSKKEETAEDLLKSDLDGTKIRKAKGSKNIASGICHILATFNNTKITFSDPKGNVVSWSSSGKCNFRGSRKSTAYAAQVATQDAGRAAMSHGMNEVAVKVKGPGMGRDSAIRTLQSLGFIVTSIIDVTPVPHNGCRPPKRRRV